MIKRILSIFSTSRKTPILLLAWLIIGISASAQANMMMLASPSYTNYAIPVATYDEVRALDAKSNCEVAETDDGIENGVNFALLVVVSCVDSSNNVSLEFAAVVCDVPGTSNNSGYVDCSAMGFGENIKISTGNGGSIDIEMEALSASACVGKVKNTVCFHPTADLASVSTGYHDEKGRGASIGTGIGVGVGGSFGFDENGMTNIKAEIAAGIGFSIDITFEMPQIVPDEVIDDFADGIFGDGQCGAFGCFY